jgi:tRNA threonylcarbamoyladenosine biosynthesis protein TsaE
MNPYLSFSSEETKKLGEILAKGVLKSRPGRTAKIVALEGELGSGKTTFVQGFLRGLGVKRGGASPTFIIMRRHALKGGRFKNVYHVDAYRLRKPKELNVLDFGEISKNPQNIVIIEWAEKIKRILPKNSIWLRFSHGRRENERRILL